jgi:hypothetical protein
MRKILCLLLLLGGCAKLMGYADGGPKAKEPIPQYAEGPEGLQQLWADILDAARKDDRDRVHELLGTLVMDDDELTALFGPRAAQLQPRYHKLMETLVHRGAIEMVAQIYERKYDAVEVVPIEMSGPIVNSTPADRAVGRALTTPLPIYAVRIKKAGDNRGLRYAFFFYRNGHWRTGNQLGQYLEETRDGG